MQYYMGHFEDDDVHKIPHKMKTHWQNHLKKLALLFFLIIPNRIRYKKIAVILVQCPFNSNYKQYLGLQNGEVLVHCGQWKYRVVTS